MIQRCNVLEPQSVYLWVQLHDLRFFNQASEWPVDALLVGKILHVLH